MSSKAISEKPTSENENWRGFREVSPSVERTDAPMVARVIGGLSLFLLFAPGVLQIVLNSPGFLVRFCEKTGLTDNYLLLAIPLLLFSYGPVMAFLGVGGMLYHAARDGELEIRRSYLLLAVLLVLVAAGLVFYPSDAGIGSRFLPWGFVSLSVALLFFLPSINNETDPLWRERTVFLLGAIGIALAGVGLIGGSIKTAILLPHGLLTGILGLGYLWAFIGFLGPDSERGYRVGMLVGVAGAIVLLVILVRSVLAAYGWLGVALDPGYWKSAGVLLIGMSLLYVCLSVGLCSDAPVFVLTRRELASFFYSPLAYFIMFGFGFMAWINYWVFVDSLFDRRGGIIEPIVWPYIFGILPVIFLILAAPLLTMRLMSEERRTQTLEVLLTAPVEEIPVVLSKFLAVMVIFMMIWMPYWLYLIALRAEVGPFDYRPLISFNIALLCSGAGLMSMGLFFSSLTRNQVAAGVMTAMAMMILTGAYFVKESMSPGSAWTSILSYFSYIDLWRNTLQGKLARGEVVFHISFAVFFLFLTVKVLEVRKWW